LAGTTKYGHGARVQLHLKRIAAVVNAATPGSYTEVDIPFISGNARRRVVSPPHDNGTICSMWVLCGVRF
jgi:hypothetical protein